VPGEWRPNTCRCVIAVRAVVDDLFVGDVAERCARHPDQTAGEIHAEHKGINRAVNDVLAQHPEVTPADLNFAIDADGTLSLYVPPQAMQTAAHAITAHGSAVRLT
jgi:hypothetical protein